MTELIEATAAVGDSCAKTTTIVAVSAGMAAALNLMATSWQTIVVE